MLIIALPDPTTARSAGRGLLPLRRGQIGLSTPANHRGLGRDSAAGTRAARNIAGRRTACTAALTGRLDLSRGSESGLDDITAQARVTGARICGRGLALQSAL